jgi:transposase
MKKRKDARSLSAEDQEKLRHHVVAAVRKGMTKANAARTYKVSRTAVHNWTKAFGKGGPKALKGKKRGRPKGGGARKAAPRKAGKKSRK